MSSEMRLSAAYLWVVSTGFAVPKGFDFGAAGLEK